VRSHSLVLGLVAALLLPPTAAAAQSPEEESPASTRPAAALPAFDEPRAGSALVPTHQPGCFGTTNGSVGNDRDYTYAPFARADVTEVCVTPDTTVSLSLGVLEPTDPETSPAWLYGDTFVVFDLRGRSFGDQPDWTVIADNEGADVYDVWTEKWLCSADFGVDNDAYVVTFPARCIGSPFELSVGGWFLYDTGPEDGGPVYDDGTLWSPVVTPISWRHTWLGGAGSVLGNPTGPVNYGVRGGRWQQYQRGFLTWSLATGAREVHGAIVGAWVRLGRESGPLGYPRTDELVAPGGVGRYNHFEGGSIYWTASTGAREVRGAIRTTWQRLGSERSALGYPVTDELAVGDRRGRISHFQHGSVYWTPSTGASEVRGAIRGRWDRLGGVGGVLGYPVTNETGTPDGRGRFNHFERGSVYWSPTSGAHDVRGAIRGQWAALGWERSRLGYPVSGEYAVPGGQRSDFQGGSVFWDRRTGRTSVRWR
jgi:uncharacterized protein with LGFP repeats